MTVHPESRRRRAALPQLDEGSLFLTDSGLETALIFLEGYDLPDFAAFVLLDDEVGRQRLQRYFVEHAAQAARVGAGFVLEAVTWRASPDWGTRLGYTPQTLAEANREAVEMLLDIRGGLEPGAGPVVVSAAIGPRGDGYDGTATMSADEAQAYHRFQVDVVAVTDADMVNAMTITYPDEAIGIVRAAATAGIPVAISFTVETDGRLPDGTPLGEAIQRVDAATDGAAAYFGVNCAHPTHFWDALDPAATWIARVRAVRANASRRSHAELDAAVELDDGDPAELAEQYRDLRTRLPKITVLGGCCGTDLRHVSALGDSLA